MADFYELDFLDVESSKSGDAIAIRYQLGDTTRIHVVDGGFQTTGETLRDHIKKYYDSPKQIDAVIATHPDGDHAGGLRTILEDFHVSELWMLRPWLYANELIDSFARFSSVENLIKRLKDIYPNIAALEDIALEKGIPIREPFQGAKIGEFTVMAPTKDRYLDMVISSEKTPESAQKAEEKELLGEIGSVFKEAINFIKALWGDENFSDNETSAENEMSVVQYATLNDHKILLTADAGRSALTEAADYAPVVGLYLPGIDRFQVPHHGSRRNLSSELADRLLGERLDDKPAHGSGHFTAIVSAAKKDSHHPRKTVLRAMIHRGANILSTEEAHTRISRNAPDREGWSKAPLVEYPDEMEGD